MNKKVKNEKIAKYDDDLVKNNFARQSGAPNLVMRAEQGDGECWRYFYMVVTYDIPFLLFTAYFSSRSFVLRNFSLPSCAALEERYVVIYGVVALWRSAGFSPTNVLK